MAFFSIVIPVFNRANFISKTIDSIKNQTYSDWECIIVDDGSSDNLKEIATGLIKDDERIKYVFQNNKERSAARNNGIKHSNGKYICFLDSDDFFLENHLFDLYERIEQEKFPVGLFFTNMIISQNNVIEHLLFPSLDNEIIPYLFQNPIIPGRVCIENTILQHVFFDEDIVIVEDLLLWVKIALKFRVFHIEKETVVYSLHADNSINIKNNSALKRLNGIQLFLKKYPEIKSKIPRKLWSDTIGDTHFNIMKYHLFNKNKILAIKHLCYSIFYQKKHPQLKHKLLVLFKLFFNRKIPEYNIN